MYYPNVVSKHAFGYKKDLGFTTYVNMLNSFLDIRKKERQIQKGLKIQMKMIRLSCLLALLIFVTQRTFGMCPARF